MGVRFGDSGAFTWLSGSGEGNLSIVGNITASTVIETAYEVSGAISTAAGVTGSTGVSASYAHVNNLAVNDGGTKSIRLNGDGTLVIAGGAADTTCLSASGDINVIGKGFFENTLNVTGAISTAAGVSASAGVSGAYGHFNTLGINDGGTNNIALGAGVLITTGYFEVSEMTAPGSPASNKGRIYVADDSGTTKLYFKDSAGTATNLLAEGSGAVSAVANGSDNRVATFSSSDALNGEANLTFDGSVLAVAGEISGSGVLNVVGAATLEGVLNVTGAITTAAGLTASAGVSSSYAFVNYLGVNDGGTKSIRLQADGTSLFGGKMTVSDEISGSGVLNIVGAATLESTLHITGAVTTAAGLTASAGVTASYGHYNNLAINDGGTKSIRLQPNGQLIMGGGGVLTVGGGAAGTTCLSASGDVNVVGNTFIEGSLNVSGAFALTNVSSSGELNIVGQATLESTLNVTGAITTAAGLTASAGVSSSYAFVNNLGVNQGGTKSIQLLGSGMLAIMGGAADTTCLSASGDVNIVGKTYMENTLNVTGAAVFASTVSGATGITGSSFRVNDTIHLNANGNITNTGHIYPAADNTYDIGATGNRWRNIYTGDLHLSNESRGGGNEVDGTWGSYTIQEGEDDLFLINKRTGKKFRFVTEEVE